MTDFLARPLGGLRSLGRRLMPWSWLAPSRRGTATEVVASPEVLVVAHRGNSAQAPENTLPAFRSAVRVGCDLVELDVGVTADGQLAVLHDATLDRTTNARSKLRTRQIKLAKKTLADIRLLEAGSWFHRRFRGTHVPSLKEALELICPKAIVLIEQKSGSAEQLLASLQQWGVLEKVVIQSFDWGFLADCRQQSPSLTLAGLGSGDVTADRLAEATRLGIQALNWSAATLTRRSIEAIHAQGLRAWAFTVDNPNFARQLIRDGIDALVTNAPATIGPVIRETARTSPSPPTEVSKPTQLIA